MPVEQENHKHVLVIKNKVFLYTYLSRNTLGETDYIKLVWYSSSL